MKIKETFIIIGIVGLLLIMAVDAFAMSVEDYVLDQASLKGSQRVTGYMLCAAGFNGCVFYEMDSLMATGNTWIMPVDTNGLSRDTRKLLIKRGMSEFTSMTVTIKKKIFGYTALP